MLQLFEMLSIFDWISPLVNTIRDTRHAITDGEGLSVIWLEKYQMTFARSMLGQSGIEVISEVGVPFDSEGGLRVKDSDYADAIAILGSAGVGVW